MPVAMMMNEVQNYPVDERVALADAVLQTLNPVDLAVQEKWLQVADRRRSEILSGEVRPIPTSEVLSEAYARATTFGDALYGASPTRYYTQRRTTMFSYMRSCTQSANLAIGMTG